MVTTNQRNYDDSIPGNAYVMDIDLDRDAELRVKGHLYEIAKINDQVIGGRQGYHMTEKGYKETLRNVADCADFEIVDDIAEQIKDELRTRGERPKNRRVRRKARSAVTQGGYATNSYLNSA